MKSMVWLHVAALHGPALKMVKPVPLRPRARLSPHEPQTRPSDLFFSSKLAIERKPLQKETSIASFLPVGCA